MTTTVRHGEGFVELRVRCAFALFGIGSIEFIWSTGIDVACLLACCISIYMALPETEFVGAIEKLSAQWQRSFTEGGDVHTLGDWENVRVLERVREIIICDMRRWTAFFD